MEALAKFKQSQREIWSNFGSIQLSTVPVAGRLVEFAQVTSGVRLLDAGCGTGVVAITAARRGAKVTGIDLTPKLLEHATENARVAAVDVDWHEGDIEELPFSDGTFDMVLSQFAHIFAPRPEVATAELLRVLKPGGTIAFCTWPPELLVGNIMTLAASYMPAPPSAMSDPMLWGTPTIARERLGDAVTQLVFDRGCMNVAALSPEHFRFNIERTVGPVLKLVETLSPSNPALLDKFRAEFDSIVAHYYAHNVVRQDFLLTRAIKK